MHKLRRSAAALLLSALFGCSASTQVHVRPGGRLEAEAAAVYPFEFRWEEPAYRSFELSQQLVLRLAATKRYSVFGPGEFKLIRSVSENPFVGSDLTLGLADRGLSPRAALIFRPSAERRIQSEVKQVFDSRGKPQGAGRVEQTTLVVRLEVFHSASHEVLAAVSKLVEVDPFSSREAADPLPELTQASLELLDSVLEALADRVPGRPLERDVGFTYLWNPKAVFDFSLEGRPSLAAELVKLDVLEQDIVTEARMQFFLPEVEAGLMGTLKRLPGGLYVTSVGTASRSGLLSGDMVVEVDGEPALPQVLQRALRRVASGTKVPLKVRRPAGLVDVALEVP